MALIRCYECNNTVSDRAVSCPHCGAPIRADYGASPSYPSGPGRPRYRHSADFSVTPRKDRITAGLLAFFLGGIGAHKFYLNKPGQGLLYLLFVWTFIPAIISFFEAIIYFTMSDEEFYQKYS